MWSYTCQTAFTESLPLYCLGLKFLHIVAILIFCLFVYDSHSSGCEVASHGSLDLPSFVMFRTHLVYFNRFSNSEVEESSSLKK